VPTSFFGSGGGDCRVHENAANTFAVFVDGHSDVARFSPVGTPRVSDDEVLVAALLTITYGSDSMIKIVTTLLGVKDSTGVLHEVIIISVD
jgi:hypothetical protein